MAAELGRRAGPPTTASVEAAAHVFASALARRIGAELAWSIDDPRAALAVHGGAAPAAIAR
jgi:hypothetical protein